MYKDETGEIYTGTKLRNCGQGKRSALYAKSGCNYGTAQDGRI